MATRREYADAVAAGLGGFGERRVVAGDAADDPDRLVVAADRVLTADDDAGRPAEVRRADDLHAGDLPRQRVDDVRRLRLVEVRALDALRRDAERPLLTLETERGDDHALELRRRRRQPEVVRDGRAGQRDGRRHRRVADAAGDQ